MKTKSNVRASTPPIVGRANASGRRQRGDGVFLTADEKRAVAAKAERAAKVNRRRCIEREHWREKSSAEAHAILARRNR